MDSKIKFFWNKLNAIDKIVFIFTFISPLTNILNLLFTSDTVKKITGIVSIILFGICISYFIIRRISISLKRYRTKGVFAVSAIVFNDNNEILLIRQPDRDDKSKTRLDLPGRKIRNNIIYTKKDYTSEEDIIISDDKEKNKNSFLKQQLKTPYEIIKKTIADETGLFPISFELLEFTEKENKFSFFRNGKDEYRHHSFLLNQKDNNPFYSNLIEKIKNNNYITPSPFLMQVEYQKNEFKPEYKYNNSEDEPFHIDMFYAFDCNSFNGIKENCSFYSLQKIKDILIDTSSHVKVYADLIFVMEWFQKMRDQVKQLERNIRFCTFNQKKNVISWVMHKNCNSNCKYCLAGENNRIQNPVVCPNVKNIFQNLDAHLSNKMNKEYKLILSGGEPLLISNLDEVIEEIVKRKYITDVSFCTNGILGSERINLIKKFSDMYKHSSQLTENNPFKVLLNLPSIEKEIYEKITGTKAFYVIEKFIDEINKFNIKLNLNIVLTNDLQPQKAREELIDFLYDKKIRHVTFSYIISNTYNINKLKDGHISCFDKNECIEFYNKFINGVYGSTTFLKTAELIIPDCDNKSCNITNSIITINEYGEIKDKCIEKI